jgi:hypothetical protein
MLLLASLAVAVALPSSAAAQGPAVATGDFNGDAVDDLAVGAPGENGAAGSVTVVLGVPGGLTSNVLFLTQGSPGIKGSPEAGDRFGTALASGDFNRDGVEDLAIGIPGEDGGKGAVAVVIGEFEVGLTQTDRLLTQDTPGVKGVAEAGDALGTAVTIGGFGAGSDDLAAGAPGENSGAGAVNVLFAATAADELFSQDTRGVKGVAEPGDAFGAALDAGLLGAGVEDLVVGAPGENGASGAVNVLFGATAADAFFTQDTPGVKGTAEPFDAFGSAFAIGNFNGGGADDLAVGVPGENGASGAAAVLLGATSADRLFSQGSGGLQGQAEGGDRFGAALAGGAVTPGESDDLVIGVPGENGAAGAAQILFQTSATDAVRTQDTPGVKGTAEAGDEFASGLAIGAIGRGDDDLAIGTPGEDSNAGVLNLLFGGTSADVLFSQASPSHPDVAEPGDRFGGATLAG